jgi:peptidoglycan-associated lipoprotein
MTSGKGIVRGFILAGVLAIAALGAACSKKPNDANASSLGQPGQAAPGSPQEFSMVVGDRVFFTTDSTDLTPQAQDTLRKQAQWLQRYSHYSITIEGHADERGTREYNIALGARRATATRNYLANQGVNPSRMRTISYGKERPVAVCNDISCWSQNRRAVTAVNGGAGS